MTITTTITSTGNAVLNDLDNVNLGTLGTDKVLWSYDGISNWVETPNLKLTDSDNSLRLQKTTTSDSFIEIQADDGSQRTGLLFQTDSLTNASRIVGTRFVNGSQDWGYYLGMDSNERNLVFSLFDETFNVPVRLRLAADDLFDSTNTFLIFENNVSTKDATFIIRGNSDNSKQITFQSGVSQTRWDLFVSGGESTNNVGSDFCISAYADNGSFLSTPIFIERSTGEIRFNNNAYRFPTSDGTSGQSLVTDGSGNLSFGTPTTILETFASTSLPTGTTGQMIAISNNGNRPAYFDGTNWKYVSDNSVV